MSHHYGTNSPHSSLLRGHKNVTHFGVEAGAEYSFDTFSEGIWLALNVKFCGRIRKGEQEGKVFQAAQLEQDSTKGVRGVSSMSNDSGVAANPDINHKWQTCSNYYLLYSCLFSIFHASIEKKERTWIAFDSDAGNWALMRENLGQISRFSFIPIKDKAKDGQVTQHVLGYLKAERTSSAVWRFKKKLGCVQLFTQHIYIYIQMGPRKCIHTSTMVICAHLKQDGAPPRRASLSWWQSTLWCLYKFSNTTFMQILFILKCVYIFTFLGPSNGRTHNHGNWNIITNRVGL